MQMELMRFVRKVVIYCFGSFRLPAEDYPKTSTMFLDLNFKYVYFLYFILIHHCCRHMVDTSADERLIYFDLDKEMPQVRL